MSQLPFPEKLNLANNSKRKNWKIFKQTWQNYATATGLDDKPEKQKVATFLTIVGKEGLELFNTFKFNAANDQISLNEVIQKFEEYCEPLKNITFERYQFLSRKQLHEESFDEFISALHALITSCEYGDMQDTMMKDAIVLGIADDQLRETYLRDSNLSLQKALQMGQAAERARQQMKEINKDNHSAVNALNKVTRTDVKTCKFCGRQHPFSKKECPAFGKVCNKCKRKNHFSSQCKTKDINIINDTTDESTTDDFYIE